MVDCFNSPFGEILKSKNNFDSEDRIIISTKIGEYLVNKLIKPNPSLYKDLVLQVIELFPHEKGYESFYYTKTENNKPKGSLYVKYEKSYRNYKKILLLQKTENHCSDHEANEEDSVIVLDGSISESMDWLDRNRNPTRDFYMELRHHWQITSAIRKPNENYIDQWPQYKLNIGPDLMDIDFKYHNSQSTILKHSDVDSLLQVLLPKIKTIIKSIVYRKNLDGLTQIEIEGKLKII